MILYLFITGSHDFVTSSVLSDVPDGVNLTKDDHQNTAFKIAHNTRIVTRDVTMCTGESPKQYSLLTKFKLTDKSTKVTLINVTSNVGVELAISIETESMEIVFECLSLLARFPLQDDSLKANKWHMMSISIIPTSLSLYLNNKLMHTAHIDSDQSCDLTCLNKEVTVGYSSHEVCIVAIVILMFEPHPSLAGTCTTTSISASSRGSCTANALHIWKMFNTSCSEASKWQWNGK